ncbi:MAG: hypothetical protein U0414_21145 [Polyangiaceae bacterium]
MFSVFVAVAFAFGSVGVVTPAFADASAKSKKTKKKKAEKSEDKKASDKKSEKKADKKSAEKKSDKKTDEKKADKKTDEKKSDDADKKSDDADKKSADKDEKKADKKADEKPAADKFYLVKPAERTQTQKDPEDRGGVNPCNTKDGGWGVYEQWDRAPSMGQMIMPSRGGVTKSGGFDVVFHFHGHEPIRKEFVKAADGVVLVGIDLGIGSGAYSSAFASPTAFKELVESVEKEVAAKRGLKEAHVRKVALSAWSAGYGAVQTILGQEYGKGIVDTVILLDGLHASYSGDDLDTSQLDVFVDFAKQAKAGKKLMYVSHSSIIPPGYASTTETENYLVYSLGGTPKAAKKRKSDPWGMELNSKFDSGNFHMRGYDGNDKMDHCAHIGLIRDVMKQFVKPRWKSPKGLAAKKK